MQDGCNELISVPRGYVEHLVKSADRLQMLRAALIAGGASEETLDILINSQKSTLRALNSLPIQQWNCHTGNSSCDHTDQESLCTQLDNSYDGKKRARRRWPLLTPSASEDDGSAATATTTTEYQIGLEAINGKRSLVLSGVPRSVSLLDLSQNIRGGPILQMYIRRRKRKAHVSFVSSQAAAQFLFHVQQNNLVVRGAELTADWDDQQAYLSRHVMHSITHLGATRNLVIRFPRSDMTAEEIREDLDHIHRLEVLDIKFAEGHAWIQTNSTRLAISAKACLQSRLKYMRLRIDYFADECDQPCETVRTTASKGLITHWMQKSASIPLKNRFQALSECSTEDESADEFEG